MMEEIENCISVAEMRLLVNAVVSFNSGQIVDAILTVEKVKKALIEHILIHTQQVNSCSPVINSSINSNVSDNLEDMHTMFLRPDTPMSPIDGEFYEPRLSSPTIDFTEDLQALGANKSDTGQNSSESLNTADHPSTTADDTSQSSVQKRPQSSILGRTHSKKNSMVDQMLQKQVLLDMRSHSNVCHQVTGGARRPNAPRNDHRLHKRKSSVPKHVSNVTEDSSRNHLNPEFIQSAVLDTTPETIATTPLLSQLCDVSNSADFVNQDPSLCSPFYSAIKSISTPTSETYKLAEGNRIRTENPQPINLAKEVRKNKASLKVRKERKLNSQESENPGTFSSKSRSSASLRLRCRRCNERFTTKQDYQTHLQSQVCSTGFTQTHICQICGYCALTRQRLIVHIRTHSGERPHRCPFCSYAATQQAPLKRHIQNIHMKQGAVSLSISQ